MILDTIFKYKEKRDFIHIEYYAIIGSMKLGRITRPTRISKSAGSYIIRIPRSIVGIFNINKDTENKRIEWYLGSDKEIEKFADDEAVVIRFIKKESF